MNVINQCFQCRTTFHSYSSRYYCCDSQRHACFRCKLRNCSLCNLFQWKEIKEKPCRVCHKEIKYLQGLLQQNCEQNYCARCIAGVYLTYYFGQQIPIIIEMRCGHYMQKDLMQKFLIRFCISCGNNILEKNDYQLENHMKLCEFCYKYEGRRFQQFLKACMSCGGFIKVKKRSQDEQIILCTQCNQAQGTIQSIISLDLMKSRSLISAIKTQQQKSQIIPQYSQVEQVSSQCSSPLIVSRFSAMDINDYEQVQYGNSSMKKLLSKNSIEVRVQNLKLQIRDQDIKVNIKCNICNCLFHLESTFKLNTYGSQRTCKLCYTQTSLNISQIGFANTNLNVPRHQDRTKHTSVPKKTNVIYSPSQSQYNGLTATKSSNTKENNQENSQENSNAKSVVRINNYLKNEVADWQYKTQSQKCQICKINRSMITRFDKLKVCTGCYSKKV